MRCQISQVLLAVTTVLFAASGEGAAAVTYSQWNWNMKGDVLVIAYGSLRFRGNHPSGPAINTPDGCRLACADIAGCNAWTFCNSTTGCGSGCNNYLLGNPVLTGDPSEVGSGIGLPLTTTIADLARPGPYESLCRWENVVKWQWGTCSLKVVPNTVTPQFWSQDTGEGWVSGTITTPAACGTAFAARSCEKCYSLTPSTAVSQCTTCAKSTATATTAPSPVIRTLLRNSPITTDGCASCYNLTDPIACADCVTGNKTCSICALQSALPGPSFNQGQFPFDVKVCLDCVIANGNKTGDACVNCGRLDNATKQTTCTTCVAAQKTRICDYYSSGVYNPDCVPPYGCSDCAQYAKVPETCTTCFNTLPYNPDCLSCAYVQNATRQEQCYQCTQNTTTYSSDYNGAGCSVCTALSTDEKVDACINKCALRADLPLSVARYWCGYCTDNGAAAAWNTCFDCLVQNPDTSYTCTANAGGRR